MQLILVLLVFAHVTTGSALDVHDDDFLDAFMDDGADGDIPSPPIPSKTRSWRTSKTRSMSVSLDSFKSSFASLQDKFSSIPEQFKPKLQFILQKLNSTVTNMSVSEMSAHFGKAKKVADSVTKNWKGLTGDDSIETAKAVCDVIGVVGGLVPPPAGTVISTMMGLISNVLGMAGSKSSPKQKSMGEIVQDVIQKELRDQYMLELKTKIQGAVDALELNQIFLNGYTGGQLSPKDYQFMISQFNFLTHLELRSELAHIIGTLAKSKKDASDAVGLIDSYVTVTSMVELLMYTMKSILDEDDETKRSAENLGNTIEAARGQSRRHLQFLRNPKVENGPLVALFDPEKHPDVEAILDGLEISPSADSLDTNACYTLKNKNMDRDMVIDGRDQTKLAGRQQTDRFKNTAKFKVAKSDKSWSLATDKGPICGGAKYFYVKKACPPNTDLFRIYGFADGGYMIINKHEYTATNPIWMKKDGEIGKFSFSGVQVIPVYLANAEDITWDNSNPEYVWQLQSVPCQE